MEIYIYYNKPLDNNLSSKASQNIKQYRKKYRQILCPITRWLNTNILVTALIINFKIASKIYYSRKVILNHFLKLCIFTSSKIDDLVAIILA